MIDIVSCILMFLLGPSNYHKGIEYLKTLYDAPALINLLESISFAERTRSSVLFKADDISRGMDELKRILDMLADNNPNASDQQKLMMKIGSEWFVWQCQQSILTKCKMS